VTDTLVPPVRSIDLGAFRLTWSDERPLSVSGGILRDGVALVEVFTSEAQHARTSQAYVRSAAGERLRVVGSDRVDGAAVDVVTVTQRDEATGLEARTRLTAPHAAQALRIETTVRNTSDRDIVLTAASSAVVGFAEGEETIARAHLLDARSEWLAENRWRRRALRDLLPYIDHAVHGQDARSRYGLTSHGAWSTGERLPVGALVDGSAALGWQIESSAGWHVDLSQTAQGAVCGLFGPTDLEHQFAHRLAPGAGFVLVPAAVAISDEGSDGVFAELTRYRRMLHPHAHAEKLPLVYNDFMNTTMGDPTTEALLPLIHGAAAAGSEIFCLDAGWFASPAHGDWWSSVGLWFEPEVIGVDSPAASSLPDEAFFSRFGARVREHDRYHLDFRHPAARAHVDEAIGLAIAEHGVSYLKLDYNINPGAGTERDATAAGDGLLGHARAYREWLESLRVRYPGLLIENCASGAMRADYGLLPAVHLQSTSDQQDPSLYPPIAASAPASILPEQCGNWAYPAAEMSEEETAFTLVTGLSGRLYLSGFLNRLSDGQRAQVAAAAALHKELRDELFTAVPFWPLGLPSWDAERVCLGLRGENRTLLFVWDRAEGASEIRLPGALAQAFPAEGWSVRHDDGETVVTTLEGPTARVLVSEGRA
jgi:alpha-galactosidase